jgi:cystathionine beta-lyase family protein involved in aluminum resistance
MESKLEWFDEPVKMISIEDVDGYQSRHGNTFSFITKSQVKELLEGKVIYIYDDEYGHFIKMKGE